MILVYDISMSWCYQGQGLQAHESITKVDRGMVGFATHVGDLDIRDIDMLQASPLTTKEQCWGTPACCWLLETLPDEPSRSKSRRTVMFTRQIRQISLQLILPGEKRRLYRRWWPSQHDMPLVVSQRAALHLQCRGSMKSTSGLTASAPA